MLTLSTESQAKMPRRCYPGSVLRSPTCRCCYSLSKSLIHSSTYPSTRVHSPANARGTSQIRVLQQQLCREPRYDVLVRNGGKRFHFFSGSIPKPRPIFPITGTTFGWEFKFLAWFGGNGGALHVSTLGPKLQ
eukprot:19678-Rhodomonas_salina.4